MIKNQIGFLYKEKLLTGLQNKILILLLRFNDHIDNDMENLLNNVY